MYLIYIIYKYIYTKVEYIICTIGKTIIELIALLQPKYMLIIGTHYRKILSETWKLKRVNWGNVGGVPIP